MDGATLSTGQPSVKLSGTGPPAKEYTWRDPWLWSHMWQRMALLASVGVEALGPEIVDCPSVVECQDEKTRVGWWLGSTLIEVKERDMEYGSSKGET